MRYLNYTLFAILTAGLTSCSTWNGAGNEGAPRVAEYQNAQEVPATELPPTVRSNRIMNTHPIPAGSAQVSPQPSLAPPDSGLGQERGSTMSGPSSATPASTTTSPQNTNVRVTRQESSLVHPTANGAMVSLNYGKTWSAVGRALNSAGYKIMQQDSEIGAYYVVDKTSGKLTTSTPIYQVHLQKKGDSTIVTTNNATVRDRVVNSLRNAAR